jgi:hypothetical protein
MPSTATAALGPGPTDASTASSQTADRANLEVVAARLGKFEMVAGTASQQQDAAATSGEIVDVQAARMRAIAASGLPLASIAPDVRVVGMQKWEGRVVEVDDDVFSAEIVPTDDGGPVLADFSRDAIDPDEALAPGDLIYVSVRTVRGRGNLRTKTSSVRRRRVGRWSADEVEAQRERARVRLERIEALIED